MNASIHPEPNAKLWLVPGRPSPSPLVLPTWAELDRRVPVDYHMHTSHTDGTATVDAMAGAAESQGIQSLLFSEHVRCTSTYFPEYAAQVRSLKMPGLRAFVGVEAKVVDLHGSLDCGTGTASQCDAIIGSVHSPPLDEHGRARSWSTLSMDSGIELEFQLAMAIIRGSRAHILGHPMGMMVKRYQITPLRALRELADACRHYDKAFELNPRYCCEAKTWIEVAKSSGCRISLGSDAHSTAEMGNAWKMFVTDSGGGQ